MYCIKSECSEVKNGSTSQDENDIKLHCFSSLNIKLKVRKTYKNSLTTSLQHFTQNQCIKFEQQNILNFPRFYNFNSRNRPSMNYSKIVKEQKFSSAFSEEYSRLGKEKKKQKNRNKQYRVRRYIRGRREREQVKCNLNSKIGN